MKKRKTQLDPRILDLLKQKLKGKVSEHTIQSAISRIRGRNPSLTLNAAAEVFASKYQTSVQKYFTERDRDTFKTLKIEKVSIRTSKPISTHKLVEIAKYETDDNLLKAHLDEIRKTYTFGCYTATFILCRKVLENLIIHHILRKKYPTQSREDREKYFDFTRNGYLRFSILLSNLRDSAKEFPDRKLVERICDLSAGFKDEADDMTHSFYHIATKKEIDDRNFQRILDLISRLEKTIA
jgi:hypothetical protein